MMNLQKSLILFKASCVLSKFCKENNSKKCKKISYFESPDIIKKKLYKNSLKFIILKSFLLV